MKRFAFIATFIITLFTNLQASPPDTHFSNMDLFPSPMTGWRADSASLAVMYSPTDYRRLSLYALYGYFIDTTRFNARVRLVSDSTLVNRLVMDSTMHLGHTATKDTLGVVTTKVATRQKLKADSTALMAALLHNTGDTVAGALRAKRLNGDTIIFKQAVSAGLKFACLDSLGKLYASGTICVGP